MGNKPNFDKAESLARELRLLQPTNSFSLNVEDLIFDRDICIESFENYAAATNCSVSELTQSSKLKDGYTIKKGNTNIVLYNDPHCHEPRLNWTLAHEVGHIYMGHTKDGATEEIEAHWFAAELLIPVPIIVGLLKKGIKVTNLSLMNLFGVSFEAACKKISSFNRMPIQSAYLFEDFMDKYGPLIDVGNIEEMLG